jgi:RNA polymerase sigma-70 factor (ECF subfamily)
LEDTGTQDARYEQAVADHGAAVSRVARAYEADPDKRAELRQEIHLALWRSLAGFDGRCSLRTWVYRIAHNIAATHVMRNRRRRTHEMVSLEALETEPASLPVDSDRQLALGRLLALIRRLKPLDRQVISLYLEGESAAAIAEVTGLSPGNVAVKVHRVKALLSRQFEQGGRHADAAAR